MRLSWNEIRVRAKKFSEEWANACYEKGETHSFYNDFFNIFGIQRRRVARFEEQIKKLNNRQGFIDLFWPGALLVEQKSAGRDLAKAAVQAGEYFDAIKDSDKPRYQLLCDFQNFELMDRDTREEKSFKLEELHNHIEIFGFMLGLEKRSFKDQDPVNIQASEIMGSIHDALEESGYIGANLERYLVRLVFMLFADGTGIFEPRQLLLDVLETRSREDGTDLGLWLHRIFEILNTPDNERQRALDEDLNKFPYINGDLFAERLPIADFNSEMRNKLLEACRFNWSTVSPAIFGSLFQSVMNKQERRKKGAHYTTEKNIMKVLGPLFLDDLNGELARIEARKDSRKKAELLAFRKRLGSLTFFDPACGCGNFLIIAYRELRELELRLLRSLYTDGQMDLDAVTLSVVDVDQFYGIEYEEFPARIAEVAMWMMDHIMNNKLSLEFGQTFVRIPLVKSPHIRHDNALRIDWCELLPVEKCSYILGNPPFIGKHLRSDEQQYDMERVFGAKGGAGTLDYVAAWFVVAARYIQGTQIKCAFVSTSSITQGEQVSILWQQLLDNYNINIFFGHRTFAWGSDARGKAHVHCVIIGFSSQKTNRLRLFDYTDINGEPVEITPSNISPYLVDYSPLLVQSRRTPLKDVPQIIYGSKPVDDGNLILSEDEKVTLSVNDPIASKFIRPMLSADEYLNGKTRWCLWLFNAKPAEVKQSAELIKRIKAVKEFRLKSPKLATRVAADRASEFAEIRQPTNNIIVVPMHTSERREYIPFGYESAHFIVHNSCTAVADADLAHFGLMLSIMHMTWMRYTAGRLESRYRYANTLVYNTFPWPDMTVTQKKKIGDLALGINKVRAEFPDSTLANLYDPLFMPAKLRKAHHTLDIAVDRLYRKSAFTSERERIEYLLGIYENMLTPLIFSAKARAKNNIKT